MFYHFVNSVTHVPEKAPFIFTLSVNGLGELMICIIYKVLNFFVDIREIVFGALD